MAEHTQAAALIAPFIAMAFAMVWMTLRYRNLSHKYAALKRDRAIRTAELSRVLRETRDRIMSWPIDDHETCMCGSLVSGHGIGDGHSPVSVADHAARGIVEEIDAVLPPRQSGLPGL